MVSYPPYPPSYYSRVSMNIIDHIYIGILPRSTHATIKNFFSTFVKQQQRAHEHNFPRSIPTPHIMSVYWDYALSNPVLIQTLQCLNPNNNMKLYHLISNAWNRVTIALIQRARTIQTIIEALVYNLSRTSKLSPPATRPNTIILNLCGWNLV